MNEGHRLSTGSFGLVHSTLRGRYTAQIRLKYGGDREEAPTVHRSLTLRRPQVPVEILGCEILRIDK